LQSRIKKPNQPLRRIKMTKQLIAIAFAAAFGIAHAADVKPAAAEVKPAVAPVAAKVEAPKAAEAVKAPEAKPADNKVKKAHAKEAAQEVAKAAEPAKK
jgi:hypothetical protein